MKSKIVAKLYSLYLIANMFVWSFCIVKSMQYFDYVENVDISNSQINNKVNTSKSRIFHLVDLILKKYGDKINDWFLRKVIVAGLSTLVGPVVADIIVEAVITEWNNSKSSKISSD